MDFNSIQKRLKRTVPDTLNDDGSVMKRPRVRRRTVEETKTPLPADQRATQGVEHTKTWKHQKKEVSRKPKPIEIIPDIPSSSPGTPPSTPGTPPSTPATPPSTPGTPPSTPGTPPSTPGTLPSTPGTLPSTPGTLPSTPGTLPSSLGDNVIPQEGKRPSREWEVQKAEAPRKRKPIESIPDTPPANPDGQFTTRGGKHARTQNVQKAEAPRKRKPIAIIPDTPPASPDTPPASPDTPPASSDTPPSSPGDNVIPQEGKRPYREWAQRNNNPIRNPLYSSSVAEKQGYETPFSDDRTETESESEREDNCSVSQKRRNALGKTTPTDMETWPMAELVTRVGETLATPELPDSLETASMGDNLHTPARARLPVESIPIDEQESSSEEESDSAVTDVAPRTVSRYSVTNSPKTTVAEARRSNKKALREDPTLLSAFPLLHTAVKLPSYIERKWNECIQTRNLQSNIATCSATKLFDGERIVLNQMKQLFSDLYMDNLLNYCYDGTMSDFNDDMLLRLGIGTSTLFDDVIEDIMANVVLTVSTIASKPLLPTIRRGLCLHYLESCNAIMQLLHTQWKGITDMLNMHTWVKTEQMHAFLRSLAREYALFLELFAHEVTMQEGITAAKQCLSTLSSAFTRNETNFAVCTEFLKSHSVHELDGTHFINAKGELMIVEKISRQVICRPSPAVIESCQQLFKALANGDIDVTAFKATMDEKKIKLAKVEQHKWSDTLASSRKIGMQRMMYKEVNEKRQKENMLQVQLIDAVYIDQTRPALHSKKSILENKMNKLFKSLLMNNKDIRTWEKQLFVANHAKLAAFTCNLNPRNVATRGKKQKEEKSNKAGSGMNVLFRPKKQ